MFEIVAFVTDPVVTRNFRNPITSLMSRAIALFAKDDHVIIFIVSVIANVTHYIIRP